MAQRQSASQQPTEVTTLAGSLEELAAQGFTAEFGVCNGRLRDVASGKTFGPDEVTIRREFRFEGISDPDDMAILYGLETRGGLRGTLTNAFGLYADPAIGAFMKRVAPYRASGQVAADREARPR